jgi:prevent-host-death family protein
LAENVLWPDVDAFCHLRDPGIARSTDQFCAQGRRRNRPAQRMFTATAAYHQDSHRLPLVFSYFTSYDYGHDHGHLEVLAMTKTMKASECKAKFLGVVDEVAENHERIIVTKNGKPVAQIIPFVEKPKTLFGAMKDSITILGDLDEPIDVEWEAMKE